MVVDGSVSSAGLCKAVWGQCQSFGVAVCASRFLPSVVYILSKAPNLFGNATVSARLSFCECFVCLYLNVNVMSFDPLMFFFGCFLLLVFSVTVVKSLKFWYKI